MFLYFQFNVYISFQYLIIRNEACESTLPKICSATRFLWSLHPPIKSKVGCGFLFPSRFIFVDRVLRYFFPTRALRQFRVQPNWSPPRQARCTPIYFVFGPTKPSLNKKRARFNKKCRKEGIPCKSSGSIHGVNSTTIAHIVQFSHLVFFCLISVLLFCGYIRRHAREAHKRPATMKKTFSVKCVNKRH